MDTDESITFDGFYTFGINEYHYGGVPGHNLEHLGNAFWFLFNNDSNIIDPEGANPPNIFHDNTGSQVNHAIYYPYQFDNTEQMPNIRKVVQVSGLPNPSDNGLYFLAATWKDPDMVNTNPDPNIFDYSSMWLNHWLAFQKITMTKNVFNSNTNSIDSTLGIGDWSNPEAGFWLSDPVVDDDHVMGSDIYQLNPGAFTDSNVMITPGNVTGSDVSMYVYPEIPLMVGGDGEVDMFVGGIHSSEISSIGLTSLPVNTAGVNWGDVNQDGFLNILDVVGTVNYILGNIELSEMGEIVVDMNQDGNINILDVVTLVQCILGTGPCDF